MAMKLQQDQVWKRGEEYLRILHLERLEVEYKLVEEPHHPRRHLRSRQQEGVLPV